MDWTAEVAHVTVIVCPRGQPQSSYFVSIPEALGSIPGGGLYGPIFGFSVTPGAQRIVISITNTKYC